jgi:hypothetical protein
VTTEILLKRIDYILAKANEAIASGTPNKYEGIDINLVEMRGFKSIAMSFILDLYGKEHPYYKEFEEATEYYYGNSVKSGIQIIMNIKAEIENGWLSSLKGIVSAEIFSDILEMANHLLENDYKDAAAVMIGSVLEEHIKQLCIKYSIETNFEKDGKLISHKADRLNSELAKAGKYNKLVQKNVTAQLDLRNNAAHGKYLEYDKQQVRLMYDSVFNFIIRNQL